MDRYYWIRTASYRSSRTSLEDIQKPRSGTDSVIDEDEPILPPLEQATVYIGEGPKAIAAATITIAYNPVLVSEEVVAACLDGACTALAQTVADDLSNDKGH